MTRAADAPADPLWLCLDCGGGHAEWQALCAHCGTFNALHWQSPGMSRGLIAESRDLRTGVEQISFQ
jgi:HemY protein